MRWSRSIESEDAVDNLETFQDEKFGNTRIDIGNAKYRRLVFESSPYLMVDVAELFVGSYLPSTESETFDR